MESVESAWRSGDERVQQLRGGLSEVRCSVVQDRREWPTFK